jgi:hydrogenase maturation protease
MNTLISDIKNVIGGNCCLVGMGNYLKSDDAVGLYIIESVKKAAGNTGMLLNVEDVIEAYVFKIAEMDCDTVVVIDAVKAQAEVGSILFGTLDEEFEELSGTLSTHKLALKMSGKIFTEHKKETYLLGVVVNNIDFGAELTPAVKETADTLIEIIIDALNRDKRSL